MPFYTCLAGLKNLRRYEATVDHNFSNFKQKNAENMFKFKQLLNNKRAEVSVKQAKKLSRYNVNESLKLLGAIIQLWNTPDSDCLKLILYIKVSQIVLNT